MRLAEANEHVWAEVFEWLCEAASHLGSLRGTCRRGRDGFDVAVHSGAIPMAGHVAHASEEAGATCRWVHGWWPVSLHGCKQLKMAISLAVVVRVEVPHSGGPLIAGSGTWWKWDAPSVIFCETSCGREADTASSSRQQRAAHFSNRAALSNCNPLSAAFSLSPATSDLGADVLQGATLLTRVDFSGGMTHVTALGNNFLNGARLLSDVDTLGLEGVVAVGDNFLANMPALRRCRLRGLRSVRTAGSYFLGSCSGLREVDLGSLRSLAVAGERFMHGSGCTSGKFDLTGFGRGLLHIDDGCFGHVGVPGELDLSGLTGALAIGSSFCASSHVTRISGLEGGGGGGGGGGGLAHVCTIDDWCFASCGNLVRFDGRGLGSIVRIGQEFLDRCECLEVVDMSGLKNLRDIHGSFLTGTSSLQTLDVSGWYSIENVGISFVAESAVKRICFRRAAESGAAVARNDDDDDPSWRNVRSLPDDFLSMCDRLASVDTAAFPNVTELGDGVLRFCDALTELDTAPWQNLTTIGRVCFEENGLLTSVDTSGLRHVTELGFGAFQGCHALTAFDVSNLQAVANEPENLLHGCGKLPGQTLHCARGTYAIPKYPTATATTATAPGCIDHDGDSHDSD